MIGASVKKSGFEESVGTVARLPSSVRLFYPFCCPPQFLLNHPADVVAVCLHFLLLAVADAIELMSSLDGIGIGIGE